jgi:16S rRNA (cytosine967-C5)-methyltransferase
LDGGLARSRFAPGAESLADAARVVEAIAFGGQSAEMPLATATSSASPASRSAVRAIALGTVRWYLRLSKALETLLERPAGVPRTVRALLAVALHQVEYSRNAPEVIANSAVDATRILNEPRSASLVNAVLRRYVGERSSLLQRIDDELAVRTAHPAWLVERICCAWGDEAARLLEANNAHPPMTLRIDLSRTSRTAYLQQLSERDIGAHEIQCIDSAANLDRPMAIDRLPGFAEGIVSVQDAGAQLAARLLDPSPDMRVLDACAAPGGKTGHLLEVLGEAADLTAVDIDSERLPLIAGNLQRLKRTARLVGADVRKPESFWDGRPFDRILVDAPCSSTGVIRRRPDIKLLRRPADLAAFAATQLEILDGAMRMLAPGGRLLYSTCSVLPEENEGTIATFLESGSGAGARAVGLPEWALRIPGALERSVGLQLLPGAQAGTDGFYYACLEKTTDAS